MESFIVSEIQVQYKPTVPSEQRIKIDRSDRAADLFRQAWNEDMDRIESGYIMLVDRANRVLGIKMISMGGVSGTVMDAKAIFSIALAGNASGIILAHNHPSGVAEPSRADENLTQALKAALALVDVTVIDHFVVGSGSAVSFAERGLL